MAAEAAHWAETERRGKRESHWPVDPVVLVVEVEPHTDPDREDLVEDSRRKVAAVAAAAVAEDNRRNPEDPGVDLEVALGTVGPGTVVAPDCMAGSDTVG